MQSQRRLPKKSVLGTRVCAPWNDGRFYPGVIESMTEQPNGQFMYAVLFDDGYSKRYFHKDIVGPGFSTNSGIFLKHGQAAYITNHGREQKAIVVKHNKVTDEVILEIETNDGELSEVVKRLDDIRLLESRKSTRRQSQETASSRIDVPVTRNRRRKHEEMTLDDRQCDADEEMQMAARALQNLSCSPASPHFPLDLSKSPQSWHDTNFRPSPSPPSHYSTSAPQCFFGSASTDEGIEVEDSIYCMEDFSTKRRKAEDPKANKLRYKCTWRGCRVIEDDCKQIESHIRQAHLGPRDGSDLSDHEEEFYYEEIEQSEMDEMTSNMAGMTCASPSPTQSCPLNLSLPRQMIGGMGRDHDYPRKENTTPKPIVPISLEEIMEKSSPILIPNSAPLTQTHFFPQNSPYSRQTFKVSPLSPSTASPTAKPVTGRKSRSDIKKCRKVYGMENRDLWCTQCKWKKACTRFGVTGEAV